MVYGGVSVYPKVAKLALKLIIGKKIDELDYAEIAELLSKEFTPISDVRASNNYRNLLIKNHLIKHIDSLVNNE